MKGFLARHDVAFRKTHNLVEHGQQCSRIDPTLEDLTRRAARLTDYAWRFRYPGEPEQPPIPEAEEALALAREVWEAILSRLPDDARPYRQG